MSSGNEWRIAGAVVVGVTVVTGGILYSENRKAEAQRLRDERRDELEDRRRESERELLLLQAMQQQNQHSAGAAQPAPAFMPPTLDQPGLDDQLISLGGRLAEQALGGILGGIFGGGR